MLGWSGTAWDLATYHQSVAGGGGGGWAAARKPAGVPRSVWANKNRPPVYARLGDRTYWYDPGDDKVYVLAAAAAEGTGEVEVVGTLAAPSEALLGAVEVPCERGGRDETSPHVVLVAHRGALYFVAPMVTSGLARGARVGGLVAAGALRRRRLAAGGVGGGDAPPHGGVGVAHEHTSEQLHGRGREASGSAAAECVGGGGLAMLPAHCNCHGREHGEHTARGSPVVARLQLGHGQVGARPLCLIDRRFGRHGQCECGPGHGAPPPLVSLPHARLGRFVVSDLKPCNIS